MGRARRPKRGKFSCPHCSKNFQAEKGRDYHIKEYVCRQNERPGGPTIKGRRKVTKEVENNNNNEYEDSIMESIVDNNSNDNSNHNHNNSNVKKQQEETNIKKQQEETKNNNDAISIKVENDDTTTMMRESNDNHDAIHQQQQQSDDNDENNEMFTEGKGKHLAKKQYKKIRGSLKDRTCPRCKAIFTSVIGKNYHFKNMVCSIKKEKKQKPLYTLRPGERFVTKYGIVEVIQDDRATPIAEHPSDLDQQYKMYTNWKLKRSQFVSKKKVAFAVLSLTKRRLLRKSYEENHVNQETVFRAYFGDDPRLIDPSHHSKIIKTTADPKFYKTDPSEPEGSFPDRIVVCQLVQDRRVRIGTVEEGDANQKSSTELTPIDPNFRNITIYIQRRFLTEHYLEACTMQCQYCGQIFTSKTGFKYHLRSSVCRKKLESMRVAYKLYLDEIEEKSDGFISKPDIYLRNKHGGMINGSLHMNISKIIPSVGTIKQETSSEEPLTNANSVKPDCKPIDEQSANAKSKKLLVYTKHSEDGTPIIVKVAKQEPKSKLENIQNQLISPIDEYNQMYDEFYKLQGKLLGPMYQGVFDSLAYKKPKLTAKGTLRRKRQKIVPPAASAEEVPRSKILPLAPIVDTRGFISEVDAGRYPTIRRLDIDAIHETLCCACQQATAPIEIAHNLPFQFSNTVIPCTLCTSVVHFSCMLTKVTVKVPEPGDDFVCYKCIRLVQTRRQRAKKRRIEKFQASSSAMSKKPTTMIADLNDDVLELVQLTQAIVPNEEYECLAAQGKQINDLLELLRDGTKRLKRNVQYAAINQYRRNLIMDIEQKSATL